MTQATQQYLNVNMWSLTIDNIIMSRRLTKLYYSNKSTKYYCNKSTKSCKSVIVIRNFHSSDINANLFNEKNHRYIKEGKH